ncbi:hypothetical protein GFV15_00050 [Lactococcus lactis]|uniref:hypothetical protein n=1 Tax=Lactococcus lactis TaxID=1358 RepID=UPI001293932B|nr:hypothetical protein [Lactococcus lactis]MQQ79385.1 hypothetical protein [Lactococcus lactis]
MNKNEIYKKINKFYIEINESLKQYEKAGYASSELNKLCDEVWHYMNHFSSMVNTKDELITSTKVIKKMQEEFQKIKSELEE